MQEVRERSFCGKTCRRARLVMTHSANNPEPARSAAIRAIQEIMAHADEKTGSCVADSLHPRASGDLA
jgi:hypothetical protein